ncbi:uncharacterized protein [Branchiostoma lanceolatum]|uniref:uncharacterized protein n=1 Tax=Branchiostoma lanceolatum TaxID=7740 RepID=UPI0034519F93
MGIQSCGRGNWRNKIRKPLTLGAWNVRTLLDRGNRPERRTALIARLLGQYQIDLAALSETRFAGETQLEEIGGGYSFYCIGKPQDAPRTSILAKDCFATIISAYALTMTNPDDIKEAFYEDLNRVLSGVNSKDKVILLGDLMHELEQMCPPGRTS